MGRVEIETRLDGLRKGKAKKVISLSGEPVHVRMY
jgi:hypothetical protein